MAAESPTGANENDLITRSCSGNGLGGGKQLLGLGAHANVFSEVRPTHRARAIDQELGRSRDVVAAGPAADVQQIITANHFCIGIGQEREGIAGLAAKVFGGLGTVDADGDGTDAGVVEFGKIFLDAS